MDNYIAQRHAEIKKWLGGHPLVVCDFADPPPAGWNGRGLALGTPVDPLGHLRPGEVANLRIMICAFIDGWSQRRHPIVWGH